MSESMKLWRVYAYVTKAITVHAYARSADHARSCVRERYAADQLPGSIHFSSNASALTEEDLRYRRMYGDPECREVRDAARGEPLSADQAAYCAERGYTRGWDVDSFDGIQWSHLVDDSVTLCRTDALWMCGDSTNAGERISCPFCLDLIEREMRYPDSAKLQLQRRRHGIHAAAVTAEDDGRFKLLVNGVVVRDVETDDDGGRRLLDRLADEINEAKGPDGRPPHLPKLVPERGDHRRAAYVAKRAMLRDDSIAPDRRREIEVELAAISAKMTDAERVDVERYFEDR